MVTIGTPFHSKSLDEDNEKRQKPPVVCKTTSKQDEMLDITMYALNMHSKSGALKKLAEWGFKNVILDGLGVKNLHLLTRGDRTRVIREKPIIRHWNAKGNSILE